MILRLTALIGLFYALGFVLFAVTLGKPAGGKVAATDAAVVITGGSGRIEHGVEVVKLGTRPSGCSSPARIRR